jgi:hypothetical protein
VKRNEIIHRVETIDPGVQAAMEHAETISASLTPRNSSKQTKPPQRLFRQNPTF